MKGLFVVSRDEKGKETIYKNGKQMKSMKIIAEIIIIFALCVLSYSGYNLYKLYHVPERSDTLIADPGVGISNVGYSYLDTINSQPIIGDPVLPHWSWTVDADKATDKDKDAVKAFYHRLYPNVPMMPGDSLPTHWSEPKKP